MIPTAFAVDDDRHGLAFVARPDSQVIIADDRVRDITLTETSTGPSPSLREVAVLISAAKRKEELDDGER